MNIKIDNKGNTKGSLGWLKQNLEAGDLQFEEAILKDDTIGLFLKGSVAGKSILLAYFGPEGYHERHSTNAKYNLHEDHEYMHAISMSYTKKCWEKIQEVAQIWCDTRNEELENEKDFSVQIIIKK